MNDPDLAATIQARFADDLDLATTIQRSPRATLESPRHLSEAGITALASLRKMAGSLDGKINFEHTLGEGGMGIVHLATQATMGRHVAVKTLREAASGAHDVEATLRILREAWVTGALEHPNVVPVYDVAVDARGAPVIVMKRIEGRHWGELLAAPDEVRQRFAVDDPLDWHVRTLTSVCNAIHFAHSRGILHRDIKPENVMIGAFGEVYVLDWGIAVSLVDDASGRLPLASQAHGVAGTPCYMAPEMMVGDPAALSPRTDVYLLGAVFYEIFAGVPPHDAETIHAIVASVMLSNPRFPEGFPSEARRICEKAMQRDPVNRYASVDEFRVAVEEYLRHRGSRKIAWEARQSLDELRRTLDEEPPSEERALAVFNLLGECRFGYRAALSAWPENESARKGLDQALLAVIDHELACGEPSAAATLLREVSLAPPDVPTRVDAAVRARTDEDERRKRLEQDSDPTVGTRTRTFVTAIFGVLWIALPLASWYAVARGSIPAHQDAIIAAVGFLAVGFGLRIWARESISKTALNRGLAATLAVQLGMQILIASASWILGISPTQSQTLLILSWTLTLALLAVWAEPWFAAPAVVSALSLLVAAARPDWLYPLMALDNAVLTYVLVRIWLPRQDVEKIKTRRVEIGRRARRIFLDGRSRAAPVGRAEDE
ncbi:MAG: serine/threonine-protein kinase [Byssovorax sp.]